MCTNASVNTVTNQPALCTIFGMSALKHLRAHILLSQMCYVQILTISVLWGISDNYFSDLLLSYAILLHYSYTVPKYNLQPYHAKIFYWQLILLHCTESCSLQEKVMWKLVRSLHSETVMIWLNVHYLCLVETFNCKWSAQTHQYMSGKILVRKSLMGLWL